MELFVREMIFGIGKARAFKKLPSIYQEINRLNNHFIDIIGHHLFVLFGGDAAAAAAFFSTFAPDRL